MHIDGSPCKKCGGTLRYAKGRACVACGRAHAKGQRSGENAAGFLAYLRAYRAAKPAPKRPRTDAVRAQENASYKRRAAAKAAAKAVDLAARESEIAAAKAVSDAAKAERKRRYMRRWRTDNQDIVRVQSRAKKARRRNAPGKHTAADVRAIGERQNWRCAWCKTACRDNYHVDHVVPLARGGSNWPDNLCIACPTCNMSKKAKLPHEFAQSRGMLL